MADAIRIPFRELSPEALQGLIEEYVSREGTDYGHTAYSLAEKVAAVKRQLETGRAVIVYDPVSRTGNIVPRQDLPPDSRFK